MRRHDHKSLHAYLRARRRRRSRRGIALIMVLAAITVLTVLLTEFQDESSAELSGTLSDRDALKAEYLARSGINLSRLLIASEPTIRAAIAPLLMMLTKGAPPQIPVWEFSDRVLGAFNDETGAQEFQALAGVDLAEGRNLGIEGGRFEVVIVDEDAKLNINTAAKGDAFSQKRVAEQLMGLMAGDQYNPLFEERDLDDQYSDRLAICGAIIDWADPDDSFYNCDRNATASASATAPEDSFYQMLKDPYRRKNAAYDSLEELRMVRGMGDDFWATFVNPEPGNPKKRVMTVWGQGKVNVNTANAQTILAIICAGAPDAGMCVDPMQMQTFLMFVSMAKGFTMGAPLFFSPKAFINTMKGKGMVGPMLAGLGVQPVQFLSEAETMKMISTESKVFSIYADGVVPGFRRETRVRIHAVVDFRSAPPPGYGMGFVPPGMEGMVPGAEGGGTPIGGQRGDTPPDDALTGPDGEALGDNAIQGALVPNPGGTIIYWRME
ncbi:MAG: type II secretion system protein GspK [Myxococcota bacterium]